MAVRTKHVTRESSDLNVCTDDNKIKQVDKQNLLGVFIYENILWTAYTDFICATISSKVSLLRKLTSYVPLRGSTLYRHVFVMTLNDLLNCIKQVLLASS